MRFLIVLFAREMTKGRPAVAPPYPSVRQMAERKTDYRRRSRSSFQLLELYAQIGSFFETLVGRLREDIGLPKSALDFDGRSFRSVRFGCRALTDGAARCLATLAGVKNPDFVQVLATLFDGEKFISA
jgi:hypothetical protein